MTAPAFLGRRRRRGGTFNPLQLFANGEAGAWYDPGDLTAEKVAWRRNLCVWTDTHTASTLGVAGGTTPPTITATTYGGRSVEAVTFAAGVNTFNTSRRGRGTGNASGDWTLNSGLTLTASVTVALSRALTAGEIIRVYQTGAQGAWIVDLDASTANPTALTRYSATDIATFSGAMGTFVFSQGIALTSPVTVYLTDFQVNVGTTASAYQRITDFTSDFLAAFPTHALYQDAAGTTPVTALGQPVGLALDKSRGALANLGAQLLSTGTTALLGTATAATYNTTTGAGTMVRVDASNQSFIQFTGLNNGSLYRFEVANTGAVGLTLRSGNTVGVPVMNIDAGRTNIALAQPASGTLSLVTGTGTGAFTVVSVREVPGVHAIQPTSASRPALDARVNLLLATEQFELAGWGKENVTVNANATLAPDGTSTAEEMVNTATTALHRVERASITPVVGVAYRLTWRVKKSTVRYVSIGWWRTASLAAGAGFDLDTGIVTGTGAIGASYSASAADITALGNGWFELGVTVTGEAATQFPSVHHRDTAYAGGAGTFFGETYTGTTADKTFIWGADLRLATDAAYPYQRVVTATDYADVGVPRSFLFDGFDDSLYTASTLDLSGTDKVTVWAGVYKNSDAATGIVFELGVLAGNTFLLTAPFGAAANYTFRGGGTTLVNATSANTFAAPIRNVVAGIGDIANDIITLRLNGTQAATSSTDQGVGNYSNDVLFFGRRNNASLPLNGKLYIPVVRGAQTDAATLALTERYVGSRMGIVL